MIADASACVACVFRLRNALRAMHALRALRAFEWKPGFSLFALAIPSLDVTACDLDVRLCVDPLIFQKAPVNFRAFPAI